MFEDDESTKKLMASEIERLVRDPMICGIGITKDGRLTIDSGKPERGDVELLREEGRKRLEDWRKRNYTEADWDCLAGQGMLTIDVARWPSKPGGPATDVWQRGYRSRKAAFLKSPAILARKERLRRRKVARLKARLVDEGRNNMSCDVFPGWYAELR